MRRKHSLGTMRWLGVVGLTVAAVMLCAAGSASAVVTQLSDGKRVGYEPTPSVARTLAKRAAGATQFNFIFQTPLKNFGGLVFPENHNYLIFWAPKGYTWPKGYTAGVAKYFKNLQADNSKTTNVDSVGNQYGAYYNSYYAGSIKDKDPFPANGCTHAPICLTDEQLEAEVVKVGETDKLENGWSEYFLFTPEGVESCFYEQGASSECSANATTNRAYCAYHSYTVKQYLGEEIIYSIDPMVLNKTCDEPTHHPNGNSDAALLGGMSHEHMESITDPLLNAWKNQWWNPGGGEIPPHWEYWEIGDICRTFEPESEFGAILGTAKNGSPYNQVINKKRYFYQQEWSNEGETCKQHNP
jgi:hypothetical protein